MRKTVPVIIAGGSGTRLWPLSRSSYPKQFLPLLNSNETLLQTTILRLNNYAMVTAPIIVCHEDYRFIVAEQLHQIGIQASAIILEDASRNTAPAIALAALVTERLYPNSTMLVMPADHYLENSARLWQSYQNVMSLIEKNTLITFGIKVTAAKTAYGYIKTGKKIAVDSFYIERFLEKPTLELAQELIVEKNWFWNCGLFAFTPQAYLSELAKFESLMLDCIYKAIIHASHDRDFLRPCSTALEHCPSNSIDYAVMEKTNKGAMTILHSKWSDIGCWNSLKQHLSKDANGNVSIGKVLSDNVKNSYLHAEHGYLVTIGIQDQIIVVTDDAVLVAHQNEAQTVKKLVTQLQEKHTEAASLRTKVHRPWGNYYLLAQGPTYKIKKITLSPHKSLSLQSHQYRSEHWIVIAGTATILNGEKIETLNVNQSTFIPKKTKHRLANNCDENLEIIELQVGDYLDENDIKRYLDEFGRC